MPDQMEARFGQIAQIRFRLKVEQVQLLWLAVELGLGNASIR